MRMPWRTHQLWGEVLLSIGLAIGSSFLATISPFDHLGGISLALIIGMLTKAFFLRRSSQAGGLGFAAKTLLRVGIVLLGTRLDFAVLAEAGLQVLLFDFFMIVLGVLFIDQLRLLKAISGRPSNISDQGCSILVARPAIGDK